MEHLRKKIDAIDTKIVKLIATRQAHVLRIGKYKKQHNLPVFQPKREKFILESKKALAKKFGINQKLIEKIFRIVLVNSRDIQKKVLSK